MTIDERVQSYRLLDASFGQLQATMGVEHQLKLLRYTIVGSRLAALQGRMLATVAVALAAIPAVYSILPDGNFKKVIWLPCSIVLPLVYLVQLTRQVMEQRKERSDLAELLPARLTHRLEDQFRFILMRISSCGTRLSAIRAILDDSAAPEFVKQRFAGIDSFFRAELGSIAHEIEQLARMKVINDSQHALAKKWLESALHPIP